MYKNIEVCVGDGRGEFEKVATFGYWYQIVCDLTSWTDKPISGELPAYHWRTYSWKRLSTFSCTEVLHTWDAAYPS